MGERPGAGVTGDIPGLREHKRWFADMQQTHVSMYGRKQSINNSCVHAAGVRLSRITLCVHVIVLNASSTPTGQSAHFGGFVFRRQGFTLYRALCSFSVIVIPAALIATSSFTGPSVHAEEDVVTRPLCSKAQLTLRGIDVDASRVHDDGVVTLDGWRVNLRSSRFVAEHPSDPTLTRAFYSASWLIPEGHARAAEAIELFVDMDRANPDPGDSVDRQSLAGLGWSESAVTLRLKTALCLYAIAETDAERQSLMPAIDALLAAAKDKARYYGPPRMQAHNHGVMADRELLNAAVVLDRPELAEFAKRRLQAQLDGLYDSCGFTHEQSNGYQHLHASLWTQIARRVQSDATFHRLVMAKIRLVRDAANAVTFPDGFTPVIGNGIQKASADLARVNRDLALLCPETGWFSWREKRGDVQQQVIGRFGPGTRFHGHADKGSVVWFAHPARAASGAEVLADRGLPGKERNAAYDYAVGPKAHATLIWGGGSNLRMSGKMTRSGRMVILDMAGANAAGGSWDRTVTMDSARTTLMIEDRLGGRAASRSATQNFPLDPAWEKTSSPHTYRTAEGLSLVITCATSSGVKVPVKRSQVLDYQLSTPRKALTASCTVPKGSSGARAVLAVTYRG